MLEKELEGLLREETRRQGGRCYKWTSPGNTGVPDRIVILPAGKVGFVEMKQEGKKPTRNQVLQLNRLLKLGCRVYLLDREASIKEVLADIAKGCCPGVRWKEQRL
ncbi:VRR-NUC domain-containing protein [Eubacterium aggregans]|uniref:VRR-NUC domain-containing protein n=1 Tax=Eubacterium aggregans TaxID=81409 RepID=A0A1H3YUW4_9FIRM|nr:VRR-NUC domain-containing protein [Eubacterium aggregans]SEA15355.1 VRR-NUC domain-containing protein [Eubacterium aggregans]